MTHPIYQKTHEFGQTPLLKDARRQTPGGHTPDQVALSEALSQEYAVGGIAPHDADGLDWMAGMGQENVAGFTAALAGDDAIHKLLEQIGPSFATVTADDMAARLGNLVSDVDRSAIAGEAAAWLAEVFRDSVRNGFWGWQDDELAFVKPWGFDLGDIKVPVAVWQGLQDRFTPYAHGEWLASHISTVHGHLLAEHGHLSLGVNSFGLILDDLLTIAPA